MQLPRLRLADLSALLLWATAGALYLIAGLIAPEGQCDYDNHDAWVSGSHRAGPVLLGSALAMAAAGLLLAVVAFRCRGRRARVIRGVLGLASLAAACITALIGLLELIAFGCLE